MDTPTLSEQMEQAADEATPGDDALRQLTDLVDQAAEFEERVEEVERELKAQQKGLHRLVNELIPDLMAEIGIDEITTQEGVSVSIRDYYGATLSKGRNETEAGHVTRRNHAMQWLRANGHAGIIKNELKATLKEDEGSYALRIIQHLKEQWGVTMENNENIHPQTLKAFVKEQTETGSDLPMDLFRVTIHKQAKIRRK
jgi:hypothetical protein